MIIKKNNDLSDYLYKVKLELGLTDQEIADKSGWSRTSIIRSMKQSNISSVFLFDLLDTLGLEMSLQYKDKDKRK